MKTSSAMRLDAAFQQERQFLKFRFGAQAVIATSFALLVGPMIAAAWLAACVVYGFAAARWLQGPARRWLDERTWTVAGFGHIGLGVALNGAIAVIAAARAGVWGVLNGELLLLCLLLNAATMARASRGAFFAALIPLLILMASLVSIAFRIAPSVAGVSCLVVGMLFLFVNAVTVHRWSLQAAIEVEKARDAAEAATEAKSAFIAIVSHELRTPLSGILAGATQLQASTEGAAARQAELIADSGQMMRTLLNDLLDLSKLEAGRMDVEQIPFDLRKLLRDTLLFWRPQTRKAGLRLRLVGARGSPRRAGSRGTQPVYARS